MSNLHGISNASPAGLKEGSAANGKRVLYVDDDDVSREAMGKILQNAGFVVESAPDYREALTLIEGSHSIDLLLTDIVMPQKVNGLALARMARMRRPDLRILYVTGYDIPGVDNEAMGTVLRKPVDPDVLIEEVKRTLAAPKAG